MPTSGVRLARTSDVDDIADINLRSWRLRFASVLPRDVLDSLRADDLAMVWASGILNPPTPAHQLLVAVDDGRIVGYAAVGPSQDPDAERGVAELIALEVDPERTRLGHGSRLIAAAVDHARSSGADTLAVWCPLVEEPRRAFLQGAGWGPDSAFRDVAVAISDDGADVTIREVRLVAEIG